LFQQRHDGPQNADSKLSSSNISPVALFESEESDGNYHGNRSNDSQGSSNIFWSTLLGATFVAAVLNFDRLKNSFTVQAAKAFKPSDFEVPSGAGGSGGVKPPKRRQQFNFIADVVEAVGNSVVCIEMKDHSVVDWVTGKPQAVSNGSGFIVKEDGLILTNAHVDVGRTKMAVTRRSDNNVSLVIDFKYFSFLYLCELNALLLISFVGKAARRTYLSRSC